MYRKSSCGNAHTDQPLVRQVSLYLFFPNIVQDYTTPLCSSPATFRHILTGCKVALSQGRFTWRHDLVLRSLIESDMRRAKSCPFYRVYIQKITLQDVPRLLRIQFQFPLITHLALCLVPNAP